MLCQLGAHSVYFVGAAQLSHTTRSMTHKEGIRIQRQIELSFEAMCRLKNCCVYIWCGAIVKKQRAESWLNAKNTLLSSHHVLLREIVEIIAHAYAHAHWCIKTLLGKARYRLDYLEASEACHVSSGLHHYGNQRQLDS